jgi:chaperonin GroES
MSENNTIKPLGDRVVVRPLRDDELGSKSPSGIIVPESMNKDEKNEQGIVVAVGAGRWDDDGEKRIPMEVKVDDRVLFNSWRDKTKLGKEEFSIVSESDILGIIS